MPAQMHPITLPGYRIYEYRLILNPHEELRRKISELRRDFNKEYKVSSPASGTPNLALATFSNYEMMQERIINRLKVIALQYPPFKTELRNFGSFPSHTIYINVVSKIPIQGLVKIIRTQTQRLMKLNDDHKPYFILEPHVTIGSKLKIWQYEKGWLEYSAKHFTGRFIASEMLLLKRESKGFPWQILERFEFQNMPVSTKQGELFI